MKTPETNTTPSADHLKPSNGLFAQGVIISSSAHAFQRKDGSGISVRTETEISTQPGVIVFQQYFDPKEDRHVEVDPNTMKVLKYPKPEEFSRITLRVLKSRELNGSLIITKGEFLTSQEKRSLSV
jgi:hypothetical protein